MTARLLRKRALTALNRHERCDAASAAALDHATRRLDAGCARFGPLPLSAAGHALHDHDSADDLERRRDTIGESGRPRQLSTSGETVTGCHRTYDAAMIVAERVRSALWSACWRFSSSAGSAALRSAATPSISVARVARVAEGVAAACIRHRQSLRLLFRGHTIRTRRRLRRIGAIAPPWWVLRRRHMLEWVCIVQK